MLRQHLLIGRSSVTIAAFLLFANVGLARAQSTARPSATTTGDGAIPIFLQPPTSIDAFWAKLKDPDFVLMTGEHYRALAEKEAKSSLVASEPKVTQITIRGRVERRSAELEAEYRITSNVVGAAWVSLRLDGLALSMLREKEQVLPLRPASGAGWEAEVTGLGEHVVRAMFLTPVVTNGEERQLEIAVPLAGTTRLDLRLAEDPIEAWLGTSEPVAVLKGPGPAGTRVDVSIRPRSRIDFNWRVPVELSAALPPLLIGQGEVAVDVSPDAIVTRSRSSISSARGTTRALSFSFDASEELTRVDLDGETNLPVASVTRGSTSVVTIPLREPLRQGAPPHTVVLTTRRKISPQTSSKVSLRGYVLSDAAVQSGALAVSQTGPIWVEGAVGRGLQRIDPSNELPAELRSHPGTVLAYRIADQPFELTLDIEPAPPRLDVKARTAILLHPGVTSSETQFDFRTTPGRVFGLRFRIPPDVTVEPLQPDQVVESTNLTLDRTQEGEATPGILNVRLTSKARDSGAFAIRLNARQAWSTGALQRIGLIEPLDRSSVSGRLAVLHPPGIKATLSEGLERSGLPGILRRDLGAFSGDVSWVGQRPNFDPVTLWIDYEGSPGFVPLEVTSLPPTYRSETVLDAVLSRSGVEYRESLTLEVLDGSLDVIEFDVPAAVENGWEIEGVEVAARELVWTGPDGSRRYRIGLARKPAREARLVLRYRTSFAESLKGGQPQQARFTMIRVLPEGRASIQLSYSKAPNLELSVDATGWEPRLRSAPSGENGLAEVLLTRLDEGAVLPRFTVNAEEVVALPTMVATRCYLRTVRSGDEVRTAALYRIEGRGTNVLAAIPSQARWVQARVDGEDVDDLTVLPGTESRRIPLDRPGAKWPGIALLELEYASSGGSAHAWESPVLNIEVQTTFWEVVVTDSQALLGVPRGWSDENRWRWEKYIWMRKPWRTSGELVEWAGGSESRLTAGADPLLVQRSNAHAYLFRRMDQKGTVALPATIVSRSALVAICSGLVAMVGIGLLLLRPRAKSIGLMILGVVGLAAGAYEPNITLQAAQSGVLGLVLIVIAATLQWVVERRRLSGSPPYGDVITSSAQVSPQPASLSSSVGSDSSTAIRPRPIPAVDRIVLAPPNGVESLREPSSFGSGLSP